MGLKLFKSYSEKQIKKIMPIVEKVNIVKNDQATNRPGWVVTKADIQGNPIVDRNGNVNEWIIDDSTFRKKYEEDEKNNGIFKPIGGIQKFLELKEGITLEQWGEKMTVDAGGVVNITNVADMYAISKRDFEDTYKVIAGTFNNVNYSNGIRIESNPKDEPTYGGLKK